MTMNIVSSTPALFRISLVCVLSFFLLSGCNKKSIQDERFSAFNPAFASYISGYTVGEISRTQPISIAFSGNVIPPESVGSDAPDMLTLYPNVAGKLAWESQRVLTFTPEAPLESGTLFQASLKTRSLQDSLPGIPSPFEFQFKTLPQGFSVEFAGLKNIDLSQFKWNQLSGKIRSRDYESDNAVEDIFAASLGRKALKIQWEHEENNYVHSFTIDSIPRSAQTEFLEVNWDGSDKGIEATGSEKVEVTQLGTFKQVGVLVYNHPEQFIQLEFSDPIDTRGSLEGIVYIPNVPTTLSVSSNLLRVYPQKQLSGTYTVHINKGLTNLAGTPLNSGMELEVQFDDPKPEVRLTGKGVVIPQGETLPFAFETMGLRSVDVRIIKIYEDNVLQFLQGNTLDGREALNRVGQVVARESVDLHISQAKANTWTRHALDLSKIVAPEPGAIYEVAIGFGPGDVLYACNEGGIENPEEIDMLKVGENFNSFYWYDDDYYYYDWNERENPCHRAYFQKSRVVKRNVLASSLGLLAKKGEGGNNLFIVTDLKSTQPISGATLEVYDFQQQLIGTAQTDTEGKAQVAFDGQPFVLVAQSGSQRGYLRLDDGNALSLSRFDIGGSSYKNGLKGFIYGERGVWRPGDDIYLTFMLEDKQNTLPKAHPVNFELTDPRGKVVVRKISTTGIDGFHTFPVKTQADAPTGNYRAKISVGGADFYKTVKVETIMPNRLKIQLDFGADALSPISSQKSAQLQATWLHGAVAKNLKSVVRATFRTQPTTFPDWKGYVFHDPVRRFDTEETVIFDGNLSSSGQANIPTTFDLDGLAPGKLKAQIRTQVFEPGGNASTDNFSIDYHPFPVYVGIQAPQTDSWRNILALNESHTIDIATVDPDGNPVNRNGLKLKLYKLDWRWWWDRSYNDIANYQGKMYAQPVQETTLNTRNGKASWKLQVNEPEWGRYLIRVEDNAGHASGAMVYVDYPGWGGRTRGSGSEGAQMLSFTADKEKYETGEKVTLTIPSGFSGRALVSLERGAKILEAHWIEAQEGDTQFSFEATKAMAPNVYAHVTLLQPHAQTTNDLPIRMYGVIPLFVENPQTHLEPQLNMADKLEPNSPFEIQVSEASGRPMTYTLAVVDEGLLDITRFSTPDPHEAFYKREALQVKTWDMFDQVVGAYGGSLRSLLSVGGDGTAVEDPDASKQNRFTPVVKFLGPFALKSGERQTHSLDMPNYVGSVRTMVVAGKEGAYGFFEKATPVTQPLMVLGSLPRVLGPGESLQLPATVFAMERQVKEVSVSVETNEMIDLVGSANQTLSFSNTGDKLAAFSLKVKPYLGTGHIKITARSGSHSATYETDIEVRMPNPPISKVIAKTLQAGESWDPVYNPVGVQGTNRATVEVSAIPPINLHKRLRYLIRYPYGCVEQTTSSVFPQLYLSQLTELKGQQEQEVAYNIREGIKRLQRFQEPGGGFTYWPGGDVNEWGTNYAGHFLIEAKKAGYTLPFDCLSRWNAYQQQVANGWAPDNRYEWSARSSQLNQSYRLYLLALNGTPNVGAMNRLRQYKDLYTPAKWHLAAAYYLAGKKQVAQRLSRDLDTQIPDYREQSYTYGSALRDRAIMVSALSLMENREKADALAEEISSRLSSPSWLSTQTTAYCLVSMAHYLGLDGTPKNMQFSYSAAGQASQEINTANAIWQQALPSENSLSLAVKNTTDNVLFARISMEGIPLQGDQSSAFNGLDLDVRYETANGNPLNPSRIEQGTEFFAVVTMTNTGRKGIYKELALNQIFPSGWEIVNSRVFDEEEGGDAPKYQDIRDDRVYTFFDLAQGKSKTFKIRLNANYIGRFYLASVYAEAMYDKSVNARVGGRWVEVIPPIDG